MSLTKYNSDHVSQWTNYDGDLEIVAVPGRDSGGEWSGVPRADCNYDGVSPNIKHLDSSGNPVEQVNAIAAGCNCEGTKATISGSKVSIPIVMAGCNCNGIEAPPYHYVLSALSDCNCAGGSVVPSHGVSAAISDCSFEGLIPGLQAGSQLAFFPPASTTDFVGGDGIYIYNYSIVTYTLQITPPPARIDCKGGAVIPSHGVEVVSADCDCEGIESPPYHYVLATTALCNCEAIPANYFFEIMGTVYYYTFYRCILTGDADGLDDITVKINTVTIRLRNGEPTFCEVTVPDSDTNKEAISNRSNGQIVVKKGIITNDAINLIEICRVDIEDISHQKGPRSSSVSVSGHVTEINTSTKTVDISPIQTFALQKDGKRRVRSDVSFFLRPGDTVQYDSEGSSFEVGYISIAVGHKKEMMDVTEAG